ncbi:MAG: ABC transporter permease [Planctomycetia bacterium]|nr:ABC transporter permease [Planctomycetia bacterium]
MQAVSSYLSEIWATRRFWSSLAVLDLRKRYHRSALGMGWGLIQPMAMAAVVCGVFVGAFRTDFASHFLYVLIGMCLWNFLATALRDGAGCLFWSETYLRQQRAPLAIYPLRVVLSAAMHLLVALAPIVIWTTAVSRTATLPGLLALPASFALLLLLAWGLATVAGIVNVYVTDTAQFLEVGLQLAFYATPIIYRPEFLRDRGHGWVVDLNPIAGAIEMIRSPVLTGAAPGWEACGLVAFSTIVVWGLAAALIAACERTIIFRL